MNPSQEPAQPQQPSPPPADPTADPVAYGAPGQAPAGRPLGEAFAGPASEAFTGPTGEAFASPTGEFTTDDVARPTVNGSAAQANTASTGAPAHAETAFPQSGSPLSGPGAPQGGLSSSGWSGPSFPEPGLPGGGAYPAPGTVPAGTPFAQHGPTTGEFGGGPGEGYGPGGFGLAHPTGPETAEPRPGFFGFRAERRRPWRRTVVVAVSVALAIFVLGAPLGLLWHVIAPGTPVIDAGQAGILVNDPSPEEFIAADGWFTLLGLGFGLIVAVGAWLVLRRDRGPFLLLGIVVGTLAAGYLSAPWIGEMISRSDYHQWRDTATQGATFVAPPELHSLGPSLVPGFIAAIALTLLAGWSNDPDLERPGAKPGYGPNTAAANETETAPAETSQT